MLFRSVQIRSIEEHLAYFRELLARRKTILDSIQEQGKLTDDLRGRIEAALDKGELEDLYLPYKPKRRTKAIMAREKGLAPLAEYLWNQAPSETPLHAFAASFVNPEKGVTSPEEALELVPVVVYDSGDVSLRVVLLPLTAGMKRSGWVTTSSLDPELQRYCAGRRLRPFVVCLRIGTATILLQWAWDARGLRA